MHAPPPAAEIRHEETRLATPKPDRSARIHALQEEIASLQDRIAAEEILQHPKDPNHTLPRNSQRMIEEAEKRNKESLDDLQRELSELLSADSNERIAYSQHGVSSDAISLL